MIRATPGPLAYSLRDGRIVIHRAEAACIADSIRADRTPGKRGVFVQAIAWTPDDSEESVANAQKIVAAWNES